MKITKDKLAQAVPVVGVLVGAALNARTLAAITSDAEHLYRERLLREKHGLALRHDLVAASRPTSDRVISISEIVEAELEADDGQQKDADG